MLYEIGANGMNKIDVGATDSRNSLVPGQVLKLEGYNNPEFIITKCLGIDARYNYYGARYRGIDLQTGTVRQFEAYNLKYQDGVRRGIQVYITPEVRGADAIMDAIKFSEQKNVERIREAQAKEQARAADREYLLKKYAGLIRAEAGNQRVTGAKNIRTELKAKFPGVKFSVTSQSFSMGNAIDISWTGGPSRQDVEDITNKYEYGTFDAMTDCAGYKDEQFTKLFGGTKFVQCQRYEPKAEVDNG